jgi:GTP-binding protein
MDATEGHVSGDQSLAGQISEAGKGLILAMNKWDAVEKDEATQNQQAAIIKHNFQFAWWAPLVFTSATQGSNLNQLMELAVTIEARRRQEVPTGPLNRLIEKLVLKHPPAGLKGRQPKINYATQTGTNPPTFSFFGTHSSLIHFSYKRYLENNLREQYDFTGTPIILEFKDKHGDQEPRPRSKRIKPEAK